MVDQVDQLYIDNHLLLQAVTQKVQRYYEVEKRVKDLLMQVSLPEGDDYRDQIMLAFAQISSFIATLTTVYDGYENDVELYATDLTKQLEFNRSLKDGDAELDKFIELVEQIDALYNNFPGH